jgi:hypothetical protein
MKLLPSILLVIAISFAADVSCTRGKLGLASHDLASRFAATIPAADPAKYRSIKDAKQWQNPTITVNAASVLVSASVSSRPGEVAGGRNSVELPPNILERYLLALPSAAWPYGRVVALTQTGARSSSDSENVKRTLEQVRTTCDKLHIIVDVWPSA